MQWSEENKINSLDISENPFQDLED